MKIRKDGGIVSHNARCLAMRDGLVAVGGINDDGTGCVILFAVEEVPSALGSLELLCVACISDFSLAQGGFDCLAFAGAQTLYCAHMSRSLLVCEPDTAGSASGWVPAHNGTKRLAHSRRITAMAAVPGSVTLMITASSSESCLKVWHRPPQSAEALQLLQTVMVSGDITGLTVVGERLAFGVRGGVSGMVAHDAVRFYDLDRSAAWSGKQVKVIKPAGTESVRLSGWFAFCGEGLIVSAGARHVSDPTLKRTVRVHSAPSPAQMQWQLLPTLSQGTPPAPPTASTTVPAQLPWQLLATLARWDHLASVCAMAACSGLIVVGTEDGLVHAIALRAECRGSARWE